jgi:hypothetical protein
LVGVVRKPRLDRLERVLDRLERALEHRPSAAVYRIERGA